MQMRKKDEMDYDGDGVVVHARGTDDADVCAIALRLGATVIVEGYFDVTVTHWGTVPRMHIAVMTVAGLATHTFSLSSVRGLQESARLVVDAILAALKELYG